MEDSSIQQGHLSIEDLSTVFKELYDVRSEWVNFGLELKIRDPDLKAIKEKCNGDPGECLRELLSVWLKQNDPKPTCAKLASALKSPTVGYAYLSEKVMPEYVSHSTHSKTVTLDPSDSCQSHLQLQVGTARSEDFRCPCGKCDLISYLDKGCPKSNSHSYPYLPLDHLSDDDKEDLIQKLSDDTANIIKDFADLFMNTCVSLKAKQITIAQLTNAALSLGAHKSQSNPLPLLEPDEANLRGSTNLDDAFNVLRKHVSFFNYEILGHVIEYLGEPEDKKNFDRFCSKFKEFCQRKLFEVSPRAFSPSGDQLQRPFVILGTKDMFEKLIDVKDAQRRVASILGLRSSTLQLKQIDISSVILVFSIPEKISDTVFPLERDTINELKGSGYTPFYSSTLGSTAYQPLDVQFQLLRSSIPMDECQQREPLTEYPVIRATTLNFSSCSSTTLYDARSKCEEFDQRFCKLLHKTKLELTAKKSKSVMFTRARTRKKSLPYSVKKNHYRYVRETVSSPDKENVNLDEFFSYVDMYSCNCFEYKLLEEVVESSNCSPALCNEMHLYAKDIQGFQQYTTSLELVRQNVGSEMEFIPPHFEHMTTFHPQKCTLEALYAFRKEACLSMELPEYAILNNSLTPGSIRVTWMFPVELRSNILPFLCGRIGQRLLQTYCIETLVIADHILHQNTHLTGCASDAPENVDTKAVKLQDLPEDHYCKLLLSVIKQGDSASEKVKSLLEDKDDIEVIINCTDENGCTPLFIATLLGSLEIVKLLIRYKANVTTTDKNGKTNLMGAVESENTQLVQMYLDDIQVDVNIQEKEYGWSALHFAAKIGSIEIVKLLIRPESAAHITVKAHDGRTPVDVATESGHKEIAQLLTSEVNFETDDDEEEGIQDKQGKDSDTDEKEHVKQENIKGGVDELEHGTRVHRKYQPIIPWRKSKLTKAARNGLTDDVRRLLENGHDPNTVKGDLSKWTPLMYASHQGCTEIVRLLLKYGAKPDLQSSGEGWTALILASYRGFVEVVKLLISYGIRCDVNKQTNRRRITALQRVCLYSPVRYVFMRYAPSERRGEVVKLLLDNGADITLVDNQNRTPLIAASRSGFQEIVKHILERIKKDFPDEKDRKKILDHEMDGTWTALMEASEEGHTAIVKMLLEAGATANKAKKDKDSALHVAAYHGHDDIVELLSKQMNKEDINAKNDDGFTPLMLAMKRKKVQVQQKLKVIDQLMEHGADLDVTTDANKTAMMYAQKSGSKDVLERLKYWANVTRTITDSVRRQVT